MAVYDGFFDAVADEETGEFDRAYGSGNFTDYFAHIIGSGVCIHNNQDSFKVRFENGSAMVSPGYLFIEGYWLKNDSDYSIPVTGTATLAIVAHLNLGTRMIELEARSVAQAYPDSLVLALVNPAAGTAEDTRHNSDLCGTINTAGELSKKVEWAVNYIDNEIKDKLAAAEADIAEQSQKLDAKIAEVQAQVDKITPPPVGSIKFSASEDVGPEWLPCNGDFVSESQYPELVAALGKLTPSGDKFELISDGEIGPQISNGVVYNGWMWVYSYSSQKLYGVDLDGVQTIKEITLSSDDSTFTNFTPPTTQIPLALSIVFPASGRGSSKIFLSQVQNELLIFGADFDPLLDNIVLSKPFTSIEFSAKYDSKSCVPYVCSAMDGGNEYFYCATTGVVRGAWHSIRWKDGENAMARGNAESDYGFAYSSQRLAYSQKNRSESVAVICYQHKSATDDYDTRVLSDPNELFSRESYYMRNVTADTITVPNSLNVVGSNKLLFEFTPKFGLTISLTDVKGPVKFETGILLPSAARCFVDAASYLWGKDIYMIFVGTGIIFSRTLEEGSFGYLDTTSVLGTITQFGYLDYSQDEGTLYIVGQDTANRVKVAKIVLNTLYDYANDGAWLPMIASDGVPAYIKAYEPEAVL